MLVLMPHIAKTLFRNSVESRRMLARHFRFRRSIKILPGIRLNVGKRGVSTSIGVRGAHITVGHGQVNRCGV